MFGGWEMSCLSDRRELDAGGREKECGKKSWKERWMWRVWRRARGS